MSKLPSFQFYPGDWMKDPDLRRCSKSARGVWIDMICLSFECEERGVFASNGEPWPDSDIAAAVGGDCTEVLSAIAELLSKGVCSRNKSGAIFCRRVVRDENKRRLCSEAGKAGGGNPALTFKGDSKGSAKGVVKGGSKRNPKASSSISSSSSTSDKEENHKNDSCSEVSVPEPAEPPVLVFPVIGAPGTWNLTQSKIDEYQGTYIGLDVLGECRKSRQWVIDNPTKRKTAGGMAKFLNSWLSRAQNSGGGRSVVAQNSDLFGSLRRFQESEEPHDAE